MATVYIPGKNDNCRLERSLFAVSLTYFSIINMETGCSSETSVHPYLTARHYILDVKILHRFFKSSSFSCHIRRQFAAASDE
jgi:hypothetical protein